mmetsp:Transcript_41621/g.63527  ORF Transcript_41621/g.63527 Transcript_41621/m.63527 type:complete len:133 (+) Transcript_41621:170-568(+)
MISGGNGINIPACRITDEEGDIDNGTYKYRPQIFSEQNIKITEEADRTIGDTNDEPPLEMTSSQMTRTLIMNKPEAKQHPMTSDHSKMQQHKKEAHQVLKLDHFFGGNHHTPGNVTSHAQSKKNTEMFSPSG